MLPENLYTSTQVRELDRMTIEEHGIPGYELMQRAGLAAFQQLKTLWPQARYIHIYCGLGNNGGDGYILASYAAQAGLRVTIIQLGDENKIHGYALMAREDWLKLGCSCKRNIKPDVIVDAIFGTGLTRPAQDEWLGAIQQINASEAPVLSIDVPSGLDSDTGMPLGAAVIATATITFIGMKQGLLTGKAADFTGLIKYAALGVPEAVYKQTRPAVRRLDQGMLAQSLPARPASTHKGEYGHVMIIGGMETMQGAAQMAGEASARSGAGLTTVASAQGASLRPEIMWIKLEHKEAVERALHRATVLAVGPGLDINQRSSKVFDMVIEQGKPMVVDADALNLLAELPQYNDNWILTPHPGEASRLLSANAVDVQRDRFAACKAIQEKYGGVCVLKGFGTIITDGNETALCSDGNPGMASGGMGDILCGLIAGLLAQKLSPLAAASAGVYIHARAADLASEACGQRGLLATDLLPFIHQLVNPGHN